jgi:hypothetical protein
MDRLQERLGIPFVSGVIVVVLGTQFVAGLVDTGRWGWPIIAYPMYQTPHYENDRVLHDVSVYAELDGGTRSPIKREQLGMQFWVFDKNVVEPIRTNDRALLNPLVDRLCAESESRLRRLVYEDLGVAVTRAGPVFGLEPIKLGSLEVTCQ